MAKTKAESASLVEKAKLAVAEVAQAKAELLAKHDNAVITFLEVERAFGLPLLLEEDVSSPSSLKLPLTARVSRAQERVDELQS